MKYLIVLNHALYLRNYGAVLLALAESGNQVDIAFTAPRPGDDDIFRRVFSGRASVRLLDAPTRVGWWWAAIDPIRALRDYLHYLQPAFDNAPRLVERASRRVPRWFRSTVGRRGGSVRRRRLFDAPLAALEKAIPADPGIAAWLERYPADAILLSPLIEFSYEQLHILKAAKARAIPTGHLVASWDNLSNKGRIQIPTDICLVWNRFQAKEAAELHDLPEDHIAVTGAQLYDHWFAMTPRDDREAYCATLGLDPALPIILYACSSPFICPDEVGFVQRWLQALRNSDDPVVRTAQIVLRPHPAHAKQWRQVDLSTLGPVVISPATGAAPIEEAERQFLFDTLSHAATVVGINTSVFLEAGIVGRRCLTVATTEFEGSQTGTIHFGYLVEGGLIEVAPDLPEHVAVLGAALQSEGPSDKAVEFVKEFLRPHGGAEPAVPIAQAAIEGLANMTVAPERPTLMSPVIRALLFPVAALYLRPRYLARLAKRPGAVQNDGPSSSVRISRQSRL